MRHLLAEQAFLERHPEEESGSAQRGLVLGGEASSECLLCAAPYSEQVMWLSF